MSLSQRPPAGPDCHAEAPEARGRIISKRFETLIEKSVGIVPAELVPHVRKNMKDKTWLSDGNGPDADGILFHSMMKSRLSILVRMDDDFRTFAGVLGWDGKTVTAAADMLLPLLDVSERTCFTYYGHQYRAMLYAGVLLDYRGIAGSERAEMLLGALMHDIGKAAVPGKTLRIKGRDLEDEEKDSINSHPRYGKDILLAAFASLARTGSAITHGDGIVDIAFSHQEKFSGKGYPKGAAGEGISIGARIATFCDVMDTMTSVRVYSRRNPKTFEEARTEALDQLDKHFNKRIVRDFLRAAEDGGVKERIFKIILSAGGTPE